MNALASLVLKIMYVTRYVTQCSQHSEITNTDVSQGLWSHELIRRLNKHSCRPGNIHKDTTLLHRLKAGTFMELGQVEDLEVCVLQCCEIKHCDLALFQSNFCYGITCFSPQHCKTVPAYGDDNIVAVSLTKTASGTNLTKHEKQISQSGDSKRKKTTSQFVFYPIDSENASSDLAFSVNLRNIAKHYVHDKNVRNVLTAKADEHLTSGTQKNLARNDAKNISKLDEFLTKSHVRSKSQDTSHTAQSGKRSETFPKPIQHNTAKSTEWGPKLLKAAISSSSIALLIVLIVLLAITRKKRGK